MQDRPRNKVTTGSSGETKVILGLFRDAGPTDAQVSETDAHAVADAAGAIERLRELGIEEKQMTVMSDVPYTSEMLGLAEPKGGVLPVVGLGALVGVSLGLAFTVGSFLLYPLIQGGQPIVPVPPSLIIIFETTMLGIMWAAFFGWLFVNRLPAFGRPAYDSRISSGDIGIMVEMPSSLSARVESVFLEAGAADVQAHEANWINTGAWFRLAASAGAGLLVVGGITLLFFYDIVRIPFPTQMADQASIAYVQGPRLAAPADAVPIQGPVLISGAPASEPISPTVASLQRGQVLFNVNCALCHGETGVGDGPLSQYFAPRPADLTSSVVRSVPDSTIFLVITQGSGSMPSLAENLLPVERWDVLNYVRSLETNGGQP